MHLGELHGAYMAPDRRGMGLVLVRRLVAVAMILSKDTLRACYDFLSETLPFKHWNLPDGEDVEFRVVRDPSLFGWHMLENGRHVIGISMTTVRHTDTLIRTMAHEKVHVHEHRSGPCRLGHSRAFRRWAAQVCKHHGFDPGAF